MPDGSGAGPPGRQATGRGGDYDIDGKKRPAPCCMMRQGAGYAFSNLRLVGGHFYVLHLPGAGYSIGGSVVEAYLDFLSGISLQVNRA